MLPVIELYGREVVLTRRKKLDLDSAAERLALPEEALGALLVTVIGRRRILIENHRGIEQYSADFIRLSDRAGALCVYGSGLGIRLLGKSKLALEGEIHSLEWET